MGKRDNFYQSKVWKRQRKYIWLKQNCLCAICKKPVWINGISNKSIPQSKRLRGIVHHKEFLNNENIDEDNITLNEDNLVGLCIVCHQHLHSDNKYIRNDIRFDENGNVVKNEHYDKIKSNIPKPPLTQ